MRLVEGIVGEGDEDVPQCLDGTVGVAIGLHPLAEGDVLLVEDLLLLLAHRATQEIGVAEGVARELLRDGHDLLLIDDQAVGVAEDLSEGLSELRMNGHHRLATVLAVGVVVVRIGTHRPGSVEGEDGRDVLEGVRLHRAQERAHRAAVQLEDPQGLAARQQIEGGAVGQRKILEDDGLAAIGLDVGEAIVEDGEIAQSQEVHLEQAEGLARTHIELRDDRAILLASPHGDDVHEWLATQDDARGVHAWLALQTLKAPGGVDHLGDVGVRVVQRTELCGLAVARVLLVEDAGQRDVLAHHRRRQGLGDPVAEGVGVAEYARGVLDRGLGLDRAEGHDLRDALLAVLLGGVADHVGAATLIEVDIDVGHGDALRVEEALEEEPVLDRIEVGDAQGVGDHGARRGAAAGAHADAVVLGVAHEVGDDEEVAREAHLGDDTELVGGLAAYIVGYAVGVAPREAALDLGDKPRVLALPRGHGELRHEVGALVEGHLAALRDEQGVVAGLGQLAPDIAHLRGRLEVEVARIEAEALGVVHRRTRADAQQHIVGVGVTRLDVVQVIGGDEWEVERSRDLEKVLAEAPLDSQAVIHDLDEVVVFAQDVSGVGCRGKGLVVVARLEPAVDLPGGAARGADESLAVGVEEFAIESRLEVVALEAGERREAEEVVHAAGVLRPQGHVGVALRAAAAGSILARAFIEAAAEVEGAALEPTLGCVVALESDDRLDAGGLGGLVEVVGAVEGAVIGHRDRGHALRSSGGHQIGQSARAVEHGVFGVHVEVDEVAALPARGHPPTLVRRTDVARPPTRPGDDPPKEATGAHVTPGAHHRRLCG